VDRELLNYRHENVVVGSGPVGVAVALALLEQGQSVLIVDGGEKLEESALATLTNAQSLKKPEMDESFAQMLKNGVSASSKGVQIKRVYGSDYPYRGSEIQVHPASTGTGQITPSLAEGGYSSVWGAAIMPYPESELQGWPVDYGELARAYKAIGRYMRVSGSDDEHPGSFPSIGAANIDLPLTTPARQLYETLRKKEARLNKEGMHILRARLAFRHSWPDAEGIGNSCSECGLCMYGCPHELIFSSSMMLSQLKQKYRGLLKHLQGVVVDRVVEVGNSCQIEGRIREGFTPFVLECSQTYLSAGALGSTRVLLNSMDAFNQKISLKTSEYFMIPLLGPKFGGDLDSPRHNTLAQLFVEVSDPRLTDKIIHLQLYSYNDLFKKGMEHMLGPASRFASPVLRRMYLIQGYLHSDVSSSLEVGLAGQNDRRLLMKGVKSAEAPKVIRRLVWKLTRLARLTRLFPLAPMVSIGDPGDGRHVGGSFPMSLSNQPYSTDPLGRPIGREGRFSRIFAMDSSNFPSVPAPTITLSAMANGYRIASTLASRQRELGT
jgi:choline dehydrogenase-like flavoprotein